ncbi:hypothetical protein A1OE_525 [Candidatus Endolissoclinum faulkneri L2]|uniref:Uncharacterized protein n=1 Tax=Candidatus Endolissoclinum faulkneri L2 TaxID=1193729 RepID=K7Z3Y3_9PROT|nr:hypothetical protein A1OE_525 [Candidatus Endolissoclinum faulkneri L2]
MIESAVPHAPAPITANFFISLSMFMLQTTAYSLSLCKIRKKTFKESNHYSLHRKL